MAFIVMRSQVREPLKQNTFVFQKDKQMTCMTLKKKKKKKYD